MQSPHMQSPHPGYDPSKRLLDLLGATLGLLLLSPVLLVVAFLVKRRLGSPVLFRQTRSGRHGIPFELNKFRSMTDERGPDGELLPDADRLPSFGVWLRSTSLDELPGFLNVLRGEMSLVGPRPLYPKYDALYSRRQSLRLTVLPGVTGWAQINGRNALTWEEKLELDAWYVENRSLLLDLRILLGTVLKVVRRSDISSDGHATMPEFTGSPGETEED